MIKVVEQSTTERNKETEELFHQIQPYLDEGYAYRESLIRVGRITKNTNLNHRKGWFHHLIKYGEGHGYKYRFGKPKELNGRNEWKELLCGLHTEKTEYL